MSPNAQFPSFHPNFRRQNHYGEPQQNPTNGFAWNQDNQMSRIHDQYSRSAFFPPANSTAIPFGLQSSNGNGNSNSSNSLLYSNLSNFQSRPAHQGDPYQANSPFSPSINVPVQQPSTSHPAMDKFLQNQDLPFISQQVSNVLTWATTDKNASSQIRSGAPEFSEFRKAPSQGGSTTHGHDSGYVTYPNHPPSIADSHHTRKFSHPGSDGQALADNFQGVNLQPGAEPLSYRQMSELQPAAPDARQHHNVPNTNQKRCTYTDCKNLDLMGPSQYKKHMQRHEKPFKCDLEDCLIEGRGFTSKNDLDRHIKSVHKVQVSGPNERSYLCQGKPACRRKDKIWPRLDNFKSHCTRMHPSDDLESLISRSEEAASASRSTQTHPRSRYDQAQLSQVKVPSPPTSPHQLPVTAQESTTGGAQTLLNMRQSGRAIPTESTEALDTCEYIRNPATRSYRLPSSKADLADVPVPTLNSHQIMPLGAIDAAGYYHGNDIRPGSEPNDAANNKSNLADSDDSEVQNPLAQDSAQSDLFLPSALNYQQDSYPRHIEVLPTLIECLRKDFEASSERGTFTPEDAMQSVRNRLSSLFGNYFSATVGLPGAANDACHVPQKRSAEQAGIVDDGVQRLIDDETALCDGEDQDRSTHGTGSGKKQQVQCRSCLKTMSRMCDLKKHVKRHTRPWGCTNETCHKTFGSKNDWKRHENSQHYQTEAWRCGQWSGTSLIQTCARVYFREEEFQGHLRKSHGIVDNEKLRGESRDCRVGRNWQERFWCGFCRKIIKLKRPGLQAWDERFNHIDDMHFKKGEIIENWYPLDKDRPKGTASSPEPVNSDIRNKPPAPPSPPPPGPSHAFMPRGHEESLADNSATVGSSQHYERSFDSGDSTAVFSDERSMADMLENLSS